MKHILKILCICIFWYLALSQVWAGVIDIPIWAVDQVETSSINPDTSRSLSDSVISIAFNIFSIFKIIISAIIILFLVYAGANMILSMWSDEEKLTSSKNQIWYAAIGLLFINIPGTLYDAFNSWSTELNERNIWADQWSNEVPSWNLFINTWIFENVFFNEVIRFMQITIFGLAIFVIILAGYKIILARGKEEDMSDARTKIFYSVIALIFVWFIEAIKRVAFYLNPDDPSKWVSGAQLFSSLANLALFFAVPVILVFLFIAAFYFITANGDDDRIKKAKSIVFNTFIATILLMALYAFLADISGFAIL